MAKNCVTLKGFIKRITPDTCMVCNVNPELRNKNDFEYKTIHFLLAEKVSNQFDIKEGEPPQEVFVKIYTKTKE